MGSDLSHLVPLVSFFPKRQLFLHVLDAFLVARHGVQGVQLYQANLTVKRLLVAFLLLG